MTLYANYFRSKKNPGNILHAFIILNSYNLLYLEVGSLEIKSLHTCMQIISDQKTPVFQQSFYMKSYIFLAILVLQINSLYENYSQWKQNSRKPFHKKKFHTIFFLLNAHFILLTMVTNFNLNVPSVWVSTLHSMAPSVMLNLLANLYLKRDLYFNFAPRN